MKRIVCTLLAVSFILSLVSCSGGGTKRSRTEYGLFDTVITITGFGGSTEEFDEVSDVAFELFEEYNRLYDIYYSYRGINNLKTVNDNAGIAPVEVDAKIIELIEYGKYIYDLTSGETNIAMGSVLRLWSAAAERGDGIPTDEALGAASEHTDISDIIVDREGSTVYISDPELSIDVGAIAKGYAAEKVADAIKGMSDGGYIINAGGNIVAVRDKSGDAWKVDIIDPTDEDTPIGIFLSDAAAVTSGSYQRYFEYNGKRYHHIIDADTLYPSEYFLSVTIVSDSSALADALSTALFSMPYEDGVRLAERAGVIGAMWIYPDGSTAFTDGFSGLLR